MLIRALIVLLAVLNLGVAAWWLSRPAVMPPPPPEVPAGVAMLELVKASAVQGVEKKTVAPPPPPEPAEPANGAAVATACYRFGPFADRAAAEQSRARLGGSVLRASTRELPGAGASGYRVLLPPAPTREEAQAAVQRLGVAGFDDFLVVNNGDEANSVALGRYRGREGALRRQAELVAAGFPAEVRAIGRETPSQWWLHAAAPATATAAILQQQAGSAEAAPQDCAALR